MIYKSVTTIPVLEFKACTNFPSPIYNEEWQILPLYPDNTISPGIRLSKPTLYPLYICDGALLSKYIPKF